MAATAAISPANPSSGSQPTLTLSPITPVIVAGTTGHYNLTSSASGFDPGSCLWVSANPSVIKVSASGTLSGINVGTTTISATCGELSASATAAVTSPDNPNAIVITAGGVYSGNWSSTQGVAPVVTIATNAPVTILNSTVIGKGHLIYENDNLQNGDLTLENVTGTGQDPMVSGGIRGAFLIAYQLAHLSVTHCTMIGTSHGIAILDSTLQSLTIDNNSGSHLEDRASDGHGGYLSGNRMLGHFIFLVGSVLPNGGEVAWNQLVNTAGQDSIEDVISFYNTHGGSSTTPIMVHDNYVHGAMSTGLATPYTGSGIEIDGDTSKDTVAVLSGFINIYNNVVVESANGGIQIDIGHDITVTGNRVVSCGQDSNGNWLSTWGSAYTMWNGYKSTQYFNNSITGNSGGAVILLKGKPTEQDFIDPDASQQFNNTVSNNNMDDPCWVGGVLTQAPEAAEWTRWQARVADAGQDIGDQH